jgi:hypothetical protein
MKTLIPCFKKSECQQLKLLHIYLIIDSWIDITTEIIYVSSSDFPDESFSLLFLNTYSITDKK